MTADVILGYTYYRNGNVKQEQGSDSKTKVYEYDAENRLSKETVQVSGIQTVSAYTYDHYGNRSQKQETKNNETTITNYIYDASNRMTIENKQKENGDSYKTYYRYDDAGNMIMRTHEEMTSGAVTNTVELQNSTVQVDEFKYNDFGEMSHAQVGGVSTAYEYRPDGLRRSKTVSGVTTRHVWDRENICMDLNGDWSTKNRYIRGLRLVEYTAGGTERWQYQYNQHGDVTSVISSENGARKTYEYDAFGNTISSRKE